MPLSFNNDELLELLHNRARFDDRVAGRAAERLEQAIDLLKRARTFDDAGFKEVIDDFLAQSN